ncbi:MAG: CRISPR-associated endoribonuclease Cas6 [Candidatus Aminicenantia bacterium]
MSETFIRYYNCFIREHRWVFWLEGDKEILQFVYDYGLGVRTGQGFCMLEVTG